MTGHAKKKFLYSWPDGRLFVRPNNKNYMPRHEKNCYDWSLTWSPEEDCRELPPFLAEFLSSNCVSKAAAIAERHGEADKWHIHAGFRMYKSYNSDYKWYKKPFDLAGLSSPALDIRWHDNLFGLVGGYMAKAESGDRLSLLSRGFSDSDIAYGVDQYAKGIRRKRIRRFVDGHLVINRSKFEVAVGAACAEFNCGEGEAVVALAEAGFGFSDSVKGNSEIYAELYKEKVKMGLLNVT